MKKEFHYNTPELILIVTKDKKEGHLENIFQTGLDQIQGPYTALSLYITPQHLKNMLTAIKLMDVRGVFITGNYQRRGRLFADVTCAKPLINATVLKKNRHHGFNTIFTAYRSYLGTISNKIRGARISVLGPDVHLKPLLNELSKKRPAVINILNSRRLKSNRKSVKEAVYNSDIHIVCGPATFKIPTLLLSNINKGACLIDMRDGVFSYPPEMASLGKKLIKNGGFLGHLVANTIKLWANKSIDIKRLDKFIKRLYV